MLLRTRQKAKLRNAFNNNISTDLKLSKAQISKIIKKKIIQSGGFLGSWLSKLAAMKIVQALEDSTILLKGVTKTIKNETKKKGELWSMLLGTLGASLLWNVLAGKRIVRAG